MKQSFLFLCVLGLAFATGFAAEPAKPDKVLKLWEGKPPGDFTAPGPETLTEPKPTDKLPIQRLTNVTEPRLEFYVPQNKNGEAVIIVPGGGFGVLASQHEGSELATWFRDRGFVAAVLQHRCPTNKLPKAWEFPAMDTQRAVSLLRSKAGEFGVQPDRIGLFGFSAGGQVSLIAATNDDARLYPAADDVDKVSCRPDFLMLCYAWHILADNSLTELKPEIHISAKTPPTFMREDPADLYRASERRQGFAGRGEHPGFSGVAQGGCLRGIAHLFHGRPRLRSAAQ
jgi:acetyl esterase/lipase